MRQFWLFVLVIYSEVQGKVTNRVEVSRGVGLVEFTILANPVPWLLLPSCLLYHVHLYSVSQVPSVLMYRRDQQSNCPLCFDVSDYSAEEAAVEAVEKSAMSRHLRHIVTSDEIAAELVQRYMADLLHAHFRLSPQQHEVSASIIIISR